MRTIFRKTLFFALSLFLTSIIVGGLTIKGGVQTYIVGGLIFTLISFFIKPLIQFVALPLAVLTMGMFSLITNATVFYLLTVLVPQINVSPFVFDGTTFAGFVIPKIAFNGFFAYIITSFLFSLIVAGIEWLTDR